MKKGSKYWPLFEALHQSGQDEVMLAFAEIEALLGESLPASARSARSWWSNRTAAPQAAAWMDAGYHVAGLDLSAQRVTFRRPVLRYQVRREGDWVVWDRDLIKALRTHMGVNQSQLAQELGVRQQTISEWETGVYAPSRAMCKYLSLVAEQVGFSYQTTE